MGHRISRSHTEPIRTEKLSWDERWKGPDKGLITCWEVGRQIREKDSDLATRAMNGELPPMGWKGGVEKKLLAKVKYGTFCYLAQWQGIRGEDLDIDLSQEIEITCSRTRQKVIFTGDFDKYKDE